MNIPKNRVDQLDSTLLDNEIFEMLYNSATACFHSNIPRVLNRFKTQNAEELKLIIKLVIFKYTLWNSGSTYGMGLQNLKISNRSKLKRIALLCALLGEYGLTKFESFIYSSTSEDDGYMVKRAKQLLLKLSNLTKVLSLLNFLMFLTNGTYPSLMNRLLKLELVKASPNLTSINDTENISYEFQNRQLVWNTLTEFLLFIIPMLKISNFHNFWHNKQADSDKTLINTLHKPLNKCAICIQDSRSTQKISVPYITNCSHVYCYICIVSKLESFNESNKNQSMREYWKCLECSSEVRWCKPLQDIDESAIVVDIVPDQDGDAEEEVPTEKEQAMHDDIEPAARTDSDGDIDSDELADADEGGFFVED